MSITPEQAAEMVAKAVAAARQTVDNNTPSEPPVYSRAQLEQAVEQAKITQAEADALWDAQQARQTEKLVKETVHNTIQQTQQLSAVETRINEYAAIKPDVLKEGTPERERVKAQYDYLVSIGQPKTRSTELAALGMVFGSIEALKAAHSASRDEETHMEIGGGSPGSNGGGSADGPKTKLSARERAHYQALIDRGIYTGWEQVDDEMKFANSRVRQSARARAA